MIGVNCVHKKGEFCPKSKLSRFTICYFYTPFLYYSNGNMIEGKAGDVIINTPYNIVYHGPRPYSDEGFVNDWLHISGDDVGELLEKYPLPLNKAFSIGEGAFLQKYFKTMLSEYKFKTIGSEDIIKSVMAQMIITMHRAYKNQSERNDEFANIIAVRNEVSQNPEKKWTLKKMAILSGYSISRFSELYRELYKISPINDVIEHRISLAKAMLLSGQTTVSYVATACGFNTINYFSKAFKSSTGYSPSEYIKNYQDT